MLCKMKIQNGCWQKWLQKNCTWNGTENLITVPKLYCNAKYWRLGKMMWMAKRQRQKTTAKYIQFDAWARTSIISCNAKTGQMLMAVNAKMITSALYKTATIAV